MSADLFPITAAQLAGTLSETLFYGIYLVTCMFCAQTLLRTSKCDGEAQWVRLRDVRWMAVSIAMILFLASTWDLSIGILHLFNTFVRAQESTVVFNKVTDWINIARTINQSFILLLGDFVLVYKCWLIYQRRWLVITPSSILYLGAIGTTIAMTIKVIEVELSPLAVKSVTIAIRPWNVAMFGINAATNILTTGILVWRLWQTNVSCSRSSPSSEYQLCVLQKIMQIIAESGMVYTTTVFVTFLVSASGSNAVYIAADMSLPTAGIAFNVIFARSIEINSPGIRAGVAEPRNGGASPMFCFTSTDTSVDSEQNQRGESKVMTVPCAP